MKKMLYVLMTSVCLIFVMSQVVNAAQLMQGARIYHTNILARSLLSADGAFKFTGHVINVSDDLNLSLDLDWYGATFHDFPSEVWSNSTKPYQASLPVDGEWSGPINYNDTKMGCFFQFRENKGQVEIATIPIGYYIECEVHGNDLVIDF